MCTMIVEKVKVTGSGKGTNGWFELEQANVSFDHPFDAPLEHALNIDFVNESQGPSARVAVELSEQAARDLVRTILAVLEEAQAKAIYKILQTNSAFGDNYMNETYRATVLTGKGGPEMLQVQELPIPEPGPGEVRVRVRASGVGSTDIIMRRGSYQFAPKIPFTPGYEVVGDVEALGEGVQTLRLGQRVAALAVHGGYGEVVVRGADEFISVPDGLDDAEVAAIILNYTTAFQMTERVAKPQSGQHALVTGANGGVGTALLELLCLRGVATLGAASPSEHDLIRSYNATPIPARGTPVDVSVHSILPEGVDVAFDIVGGHGTAECIRATKRGGTIVGYGFMGTMKNGKQSTGLVLLTLWSALVGARLAGRRGAFYGITGLYRSDPRPFREDLPKLFDLLAHKKIRPKIAARLPLLEARRGNEMLEAGGLRGKIVLLAPELL